jgi:uncharacterized damage-inducible protein DinB
MDPSILSAAFEHHVWATVSVIEACERLGEDLLQVEVVGTRGPIDETIRHIVGGDCAYLFILTGDRSLAIDEETMSLRELRDEMERHGPAWQRYLSEAPDPAALVEEIDESDGYRRTAPIGLRLAQAIHHGTDHRSQICTTLTSLGVRPPDIDVWAFGTATRRIDETMPP